MVKGADAEQAIAANATEPVKMPRTVLPSLCLVFRPGQA